MSELATTGRYTRGEARVKKNVKPWTAYFQPALVYILLILGVIIVVVPLMWAFAASFTPNHKVFEYAYPFSWRALFPVDFTMEAYDNLFERGFGRAVGNSFFLAIATVIIGGAANALAGFAFGRFEFRGKQFLFLTVIMLTFMVPVDLTAIPRYILVNNFGWINTWQGLLVPGLANSLVIFLFRQFFAEIPQELIDAARVDGASWLRVLVSIILPISKPVLVAAGLLMFISQWNSFFWPLLIAPRQEMRVVQVEISLAIGQYGTVWNELLAGSMIAAIVPILLVMPFQRYYVQAITGTGLE
ncbi:MAG: carbohydrate ABC transporter permease [Chloroflexota bacterium]|nr:carbohydrate ABC transporter permease [Chloroflexota bacterium]MDE2856052.1 carbohydrate ABC transporter permease [Chloroflexota bacterium]MDE2948712.1 carbohydrate ABC transporter permease [Chloroflexota bacterium]